MRLSNAQQMICQFSWENLEFCWISRGTVDSAVPWSMSGLFTVTSRSGSDARRSNEADGLKVTQTEEGRKSNLETRIQQDSQVKRLSGSEKGSRFRRWRHTATCPWSKHHTGSVTLSILKSELLVVSKLACFYSWNFCELKLVYSFIKIYPQRINNSTIIKNNQFIRASLKRNKRLATK